MEFTRWLTLALATLVVSLSPGPGALAAMSAGMSHGFPQGRWVAVGLALGLCTQLVVVGLGTGALLASSPSAFTLAQALGAAYLAYLGVRQWRSTAHPWARLASPGDAASPPTERSIRRALVLRGWTVNALNPKGTVFLLAMLPPFIQARQAFVPQMALIGATFAVVECAVMSGYVALASRLLRLLRSPRQIRWMNRGFGAVFVLAGAALMVFTRPA